MDNRRTLTLGGWKLRRVLSFVFGAGIITASYMTIDHFFKANYPKTIFEGSFCDISAFFNCDSSAFSEISQIMASRSASSACSWAPSSSWARSSPRRA